MGIVRIGIATADLGSDGGVIDGRARFHWRYGAWFPAAGDGSALFVYCHFPRLFSFFLGVLGVCAFFLLLVVCYLYVL